MILELEFSNRSNRSSRRLRWMAYKAPLVAISSVDTVRSIQTKHRDECIYNRLDESCVLVVNVPLRCVLSHWPCIEKDGASNKCSQNWCELASVGVRNTWLRVFGGRSQR